jgi:galactose mutarotase-like enzyme
MTGMEVNRVPASSRMLKHGLEARDLVGKNPLFISTFMGISPGSRMQLGREHRAEKSVMKEQLGYAGLCVGEIPQNIHETRLRVGNAEVTASPVGATVTSWRVGENNLITYPKVYDDHPSQPMDIYRGGIPILFPIAGAAGSDELSGRLMLHGFARDLLWEITEVDQNSVHKNSITFGLVSNSNSKAVFPFDFELLNKITLLDRSLRFDVQVKNTGSRGGAMPYVLGFHPYFSRDQQDSTDVMTPIPGFENNPVALKKAIIVDAPSEQTTFSIPNKGAFALKYSEEFRKLVIWTDNPAYICFEPWTSGPRTINTNESQKLNDKETKNLFFEITRESHQQQNPKQ